MPEEKKVYRCEICGYEVEVEDELPEDFVCPLCGADRESFKEVKK